MNPDVPTEQFLFNAGLPALRCVFFFFAEASLAGVLFNAVAFHAAGQFVASSASFRTGVSPWARGAGLCSFLIFCVFAYFLTEPFGDEELWHYVSLGFRAFLVLITAQGIASLFHGIAAWLRRIVSHPVRWSSAAFVHVCRWLPHLLPRRRQPPIPIIVPDPPPSLESRLAQAKQEFEATVATLRAVGLDEDELDVAVLDARQKYLRTLHGVLKHEVP